MKQFPKAKTFKIILFAFLLFAAGTTNAQVGIGTTIPNASAQLDVNSTSKGLLPPRMTQGQRDGITNPVAGLIVWCSNCGTSGEIQVYNGITWTNMVGGVAAKFSVVIGTQEWMIRNLDVTTYRNGDTIPQVKDPAVWANLKTGAWCYNNNDSLNGAIYGKLYNFYAVSDPRGLAPAGWHVPEPSELETLQTFLGGPDVAGGKMKEAGTTHWNAPNVGATNKSGFTALPGGFRVTNGQFQPVGLGANWWAAHNNVSCGVGYDNAKFGIGSNHYQNGFSVRCLKD